MRLSEMRGKEIINLTNGARMGMFWQPEAEVDLEQGRVIALVLSTRGFFQHRESVIPWGSVRQISSDLILVEAKGSLELDD